MTKQTLLSFGVGACFFLFHTLAIADEVYGVFMVTKGTVKVQSSKSGASDAKVGMKVFEGDTITTAAESRAKVVMSDRNVINVNPETKVQITKYQNDGAGKKNVELNLLQGKVRNNVEQKYDGEKSKFLIKTPTAVAGVRGTQFLAGYNPSTQMTSIVTFKGAVSFSSVNSQGQVIGSPVLVKKGETTNAAPNAPPEPPKVMPKEDLKKMDVETASASKSSAESTTASNDAGTGSGKSKQNRETASEGSKESRAAESAGPGVDKKGPAPSMIDKKDIDIGQAREINDVRSGPLPLPPMQNIPKPPMQEPSIVKDIIRDNMGKSKVTITPQVGK